MFISRELLLSSASFFGVELTDEQVDMFDSYAVMLRDYNEKVNLTAITDPDGIVIKHFADSFALFKYAGIKNGIKIADVGTGAGFPGSALLIADNSLKVTMFDAVNKKLDFIRFALSELGLSADVVHIRAEDAGRKKEYRESFDLVTARAVAQLRVLSEYCVPLVKVGGVFASMKGEISDEEKQTGLSALNNIGMKIYDTVSYNIPTGEARNIFLSKKISHTSPKYPRNTAQISKKTL